MSGSNEFFIAIRNLPTIGRPSLSLKTHAALGRLLSEYRNSGTNTDETQWLIELAQFLGDDADPARILLAAALRRVVKLEQVLDATALAATPPPPQVRYIVLGTYAEIEYWRRQQRLTRRDVIAVTSSDALRGHGPGRYKLVTLASWKPTPDVAADVRESLRAIEAHGAVIER